MTVRYLITGGAGFLGINLARFLLGRGHEVSSLDLADFDYPDVAGRVRVIRGDVRDRDAVDRAMAGVDVVVHAAAALPLYPREVIFSTGVEGTRQVLDAALRHGVGRVVHISSTAVYGIPERHPLYEDDPLRGVGPYGEAKVLAEEVCREYRRRGACVTILRPKSFVGPERLGIFSLLYDWAASGKGFPLPGGGENRYQLLDVEDLCEAIERVVEADVTKANDTFNIGAREFATLREDFQAVLDRAGYGKRIVALPAAPMLAALRVLEALRLSPLYHWTYGTVTADSYVSVEKAARVLGFDPRFSNREALLRNFQWYLDHRPQASQRFGVSHRTPWKQGALRIAKAFF
ncbi:MAG: NAD(P)-dependent oxidoreductase [Myxococcaceae bacterium]|nr:MAG: NAD(P)-dependent oxidoreductase [Myxococcaceae bacterium]